MTKKATVIHHSADYDGLFSREVSKKFLGTDGVDYIGWDYGDPKIAMPAEGPVYIIDLNPEVLQQMPGIDEAKARIIWIDHHKTAIEKWGTYIPGYRIEGVAACRLAYQWFNAMHRYNVQGGQDVDWFVKNYPLPSKENFLEREVEEPVAVMLAGEYDVWDHRGDGDIEFQFGLRTEEPEPLWAVMLHEGGEPYARNLIERGAVAMAYQKNVDAGTMAHRSFLLNFEGLKFLALNTCKCNSQTFNSLDKPETGHDALLAFYWSGKSWVVSLYHASHRKDIDLSRIAVKYKGGGHPGACGFQTPQPPFPLFPRMQ